jgi:hypothetical protein
VHFAEEGAGLAGQRHRNRVSGVRGIGRMRLCDGGKGRRGMDAGRAFWLGILHCGHLGKRRKGQEGRCERQEEPFMS